MPPPPPPAPPPAPPPPPPPPISPALRFFFQVIELTINSFGLDVRVTCPALLPGGGYLFFFFFVAIKIFPLGARWLQCVRGTNERFLPCCLSLLQYVGVLCRCGYCAACDSRISNLNNSGSTLRNSAHVSSVLCGCQVVVLYCQSISGKPRRRSFVHV